MNRNLLTVFVYELRRNLRRRGYLFASFGVPILAVVLLYGYSLIAANNSDQSTPTPPAAQSFSQNGLQKAGYVDHSGLIESPGDLKDYMIPYADEAAADAALNAGDIQIYYIVAADYLQTGSVTIVQPTVSFGQLLQQPINTLLMDALTQGITGNERLRLIDPSNITTTNVQLTSLAADTANGAAEGSAFILVYIFGLALIFSLFMTNGYLMQTVLEEKETRLVEILIATVRPLDLLAGKVLALGVLGLLQILAWAGGLFAAVALAGSSELRQTIEVFATLANIQISPSVLPLLAVYFVLAYLLFAGIYAIISTLSNSMREGPQYAGLFTIPALLPLYFIPAFTSEPNGTLATVMSLVPVTAPLAMIERIVLTSVPVWEILVSIALLVVAVIGMMWVAARVFRVGILLAGTTPKLRDLPKLIRG